MTLFTRTHKRHILPDFRLPLCCSWSLNCHGFLHSIGWCQSTSGVWRPRRL